MISISASIRILQTVLKTKFHPGSSRFLKFSVLDLNFYVYETVTAARGNNKIYRQDTHTQNFHSLVRLRESLRYLGTSQALLVRSSQRGLPKTNIRKDALLDQCVYAETVLVVGGRSPATDPKTGGVVFGLKGSE